MRDMVVLRPRLACRRARLSAQLRGMVTAKITIAETPEAGLFKKEGRIIR